MKTRGSSRSVNILIYDNLYADINFRRELINATYCFQLSSKECIIKDLPKIGGDRLRQGLV